MSDEPFSLVTENGYASTASPLEKIMQEIGSQKEAYEKLLVEHRELSKHVEGTVGHTQKFLSGIARLRAELAEEHPQSLDIYKEDRVTALQNEESRLKKEMEEMEEELGSLDTFTHQLKQQTQVSTTMPEKRVVFSGCVSVGAESSAEALAGTSSFDMNVRIVYPMEGGTALVTFEEEEVAQNILSMEQHEIQLGDCVIRLKAEPMQFLMPSNVEMDTHVCPRRILISDLPKMDDKTRLLDRLEIHFQKGRNKGGEIESVDMLPDSGNVVITFLEDNVAKRLTDMKYHQLDKKYKLKVSPFVNGEITELQTRMSVCRRTVLLTGIPDIMEQENMQDSLEIHFQKRANGGGEVDAFIYNPLGQRQLAIFEEDAPRKLS